MSEYTPRRLKSAVVKADQLKATGAEIVVTSCHNCVDGLSDLIKHYKLGMEVKQLVNLVANALVLEKAAAPVEEVPAAALPCDLSGYRILVTDDEPDFVAFVSAILEDNGAQVLTAHDGEEAFQTARREKPDLVTLDITMPGLSGSEIFELFRKDKELNGVPICIITGKPELRKLIYERSVAPPEGYLDKPITEDALLMNVRRILDLRAERRSAAGR